MINSVIEEKGLEKFQNTAMYFSECDTKSVKDEINFYVIPASHNQCRIFLFCIKTRSLVITQTPGENDAEESRWFQVRSVLFFDVISTNIIFDAVTNITFTLIILLKQLLYLCNLKAVKELLEMIRADWRRINDPYEMRILLKNADDGKLMGTILAAGIHVMIMSYVVFITTMHGVSNSTASADDYMVYSRLKLMYTKNDKKYYLVSLMHTYIVVLIGLMALGGTEATTILCSHHGSGILQILR
ncbi:uncharacterized protein LOC143212640 [Lasioglossum baleicum]|uniref:uncharacterized protein LOC143212640 n=1 Tax=Lasioglossum baleicum TaxID=434251 RepID=UPI003FCDE0A1